MAAPAVETISQCPNGSMSGGSFLPGMTMKWSNSLVKSPAYLFICFRETFLVLSVTNLLEAYSHLTDGNGIQKLIFQRFTCHLIMPTFYDTKR